MQQERRTADYRKHIADWSAYIPIGSMNNNSYPVININGTSYQWTDKEDKEHFIVLIDGEEQKIGKLYLLDGTGFWINDSKNSGVQIANCKGFAYDGVAKLEGFPSEEDHSKVIYAIATYPTLKEVYTNEDLLRNALLYSKELGEENDKGFNICASPYDILIYIETFFGKFDLHYASKEEFDKVEDHTTNNQDKLVKQLKDGFEEAKNALLGLNVDKAKTMLGSWWECNYSNGHILSFVRKGKGSIQLICNEKLIVTDVQGFFIKNNDELPWRSCTKISPKEALSWARRMENFIADNKLSNQQLHDYLEEIYKTKLFHDAVGEMLETTEDGSVIVVIK